METNQPLEYIVATPTGWKCNFCSEQYGIRSPMTVICHLANIECHGVGKCIRVPEYVQKQLRGGAHFHAAFEQHRSNKRTSASTDLQSSKRPRIAVKTLGVHLLAADIVGEQFHKYIKNIWSCLMDDDDDVLRIGIHGTAGVGKTEVAKSINNMLVQNPNKFHHVFWVNMSSDWSIWSSASVSPHHAVRYWQSCISKALGADLSDGDNEHKRAAHLSKFLAEKKKSLLILDDVWDYISLQEVGIPLGVDQCTIVFTTRSLQVCKRFGCQWKIEIKRLELQDENYELFKKNLGKETTLSSEVEEISRLVADRCVGLPLAITIMATNMRGITDIHQWRDALSGHMQKKADMEIFQKLKMSYDYLKDVTLQHCFLYCSLFMERHRGWCVFYFVGKERLVEYLIDEGIIKTRNSRREELDEAHRMLNFLGDAGLLEITYGVVKMNALIQSMALRIMEENQQPSMMIKNGMSLQELPDEESWTGDLVGVSLQGNEVENIPLDFSPSCSKLSTLLMSENRQLGYIGDSFFEGMPGLKVLNLSFASIETLPRSVCSLVNLTTLILKVCTKLKRIPSVAKLRALKKLDLGLTAVKGVVEDIELLSNLTYLDLDSGGVELDPRVLAKFSHLQFLRLHWLLAVKGDELACLSRLETLDCYFYDVVELNKYLIHLKGGFKKREPPIQIDAKVGQRTIAFDHDLFNDDDDDDDVNIEDDEHKSVLALSNCNINEAEMLIYFEQISIMECNEARNLCGFSPIKGATELKYISIRDCDGLEFLCSLSSAGLEKLKFMELVNLKNLSVLFRTEGNINAAYNGSCFSNLTRFLVQGCPGIKQLFPMHLLQNLKNLKRLYVIDCLSMEEIFAAEESSMAEPETKIICSLPKLSIIRLVDLPELKGVCGDGITWSISKICAIGIKNCPKLIPLPEWSFNGGLSDRIFD